MSDLFYTIANFGILKTVGCVLLVVLFVYAITRKSGGNGGSNDTGSNG